MSVFCPGFYENKFYWNDVTDYLLKQCYKYVLPLALESYHDIMNVYYL
jgi:hypothetical protein